MEMENAKRDKPQKNIWAKKVDGYLSLFIGVKERLTVNWRPTLYMFWSGVSIGLDNHHWVLVETFLTEVYQHVKTASTVSRCQRLWRLKFETVKIILSLHECTKYLAKYQVARRLLLWVGRRRFQRRRWWSCSDRREHRSFLSECIRPEKETN